MGWVGGGGTGGVVGMVRLEVVTSGGDVSFKHFHESRYVVLV